jgi:hypothetical protein
MRNTAVLIQTLSIVLLSMASLSADFVCLNGYRTVDAEFPLEVGTKYLLFVYSDLGRTMADNCGNSEVYSVSFPKMRRFEG